MKIMETNELIDKIILIEEKYNPLIKILEEKKTENNFKYRNLYKGIISIQSKISYQPEILFLGINPGEGAFVEKNHKSGNTFYFPKELLTKNTSSELNWFKDNNAKHGKWFDEKAKTKNSFPKQMIDILLNFSEKKLGKRINLKNEDERNLFINEIANKIVYTNICPIATKSTKELKSIYKKLSQEETLKNHWNGTIQNFFRQRTIDLILELQPNVSCVLEVLFTKIYF
ncbi:hypothetical protein GV828_09500 [Flavobacterium sp. NST-5]|uniref:DUF4304 domain-containing protein n=2 Tax=Flavobacterium ichthyis TaxID=2698827 RepID=A0ABW9Z978_9FLAO|nr:hypothetical protein [Flavobacterium ichthyis]